MIQVSSDDIKKILEGIHISIAHCKRKRNCKCKSSILEKYACIFKNLSTLKKNYLC